LPVENEHGAPLVVVAVANDEGELRVIDAMKLRPKYQCEYGEAIPWRRPGSS
jgi:hypothetical protein